MSASQSLPLYEAARAATGIDPRRVNTEAKGLLANQRSFLARTWTAFHAKWGAQ